MRFVHWCFSVALLFSCSAAAQRPDPVKAHMKPELPRELAARLRSMVESREIAGAVWLVQRQGVVASFDSVGYADIESGKPMRPDTVFNLASLHKPIVAAAVMLLVDEGKVVLDDAVEKYLPDFKEMWLIESREGDRRRILKRPSRPPTVRDLLAHTSGISLEGRKAPPALRGDLMLRKSLAEYVAIISQQPLEYDPGSRPMYASADFITLERLIEVVSGMSKEQFLEERLYRPLGMKDSVSHISPELKARMASSYVLQGGKLVKNSFDPTSPVYRLGAPFSTAPDLASFFQMMLNRGAFQGKRILSESSVREMTRAQPPNVSDYPPDSEWSGYRFGLGWRVVQIPDKGLAGFSQGSYGGAGAGGTAGWVDPAKDLFWILLVQGGNSDKARVTIKELALAAAQ